jgi:hypothetical protein
MSTPHVASTLPVALLIAISAIACSGESPTPVSPAPVPAGELSAKTSAGVPGVYDLSFNVFHNGTYTEVSSLPVKSAELILKGYVSDSAGQPAQKGTLTFEYCSYKGRPPNDIDRADEAPKEACETGTATWARLDSISVTAGRCPTLGNGYACVVFGVVQIPRQVGFRVRYEPKGSGIAAGVTVPENFTWEAAS